MNTTGRMQNTSGKITFTGSFMARFPGAGDASQRRVEAEPGFHADRQLVEGVGQLVADEELAGAGQAGEDGVGTHEADCAAAERNQVGRKQAGPGGPQPPGADQSATQDHLEHQHPLWSTTGLRARSGAPRPSPSQPG